MLKLLQQISKNNESRSVETVLLVAFGGAAVIYLIVVLDSYVRGAMLASAGKLLTG
jgi:hypothetical protein